jgi:adenine-specific DNA-methyltransferase
MVDAMVAKLFAERRPDTAAKLLDPGCGTGEFISGVLRWCAAHRQPVPGIVGVELDPARAASARARFAGVSSVEIREADFLQPSTERFDYIIGNPPYVSILALSAEERLTYRSRYRTASGRFDLYVLFFEQALRMLAPGGRLVFITPEKFAYVETARPLREMLLSYHIDELCFAPEDTFEGKVAYPLIATVSRTPARGTSRIVHRSGRTLHAAIATASSWLPLLEGVSQETAALTLGDVTRRISCGVATGADGVFVVPEAKVSASLLPFAYPTLSGRQIAPNRQLHRHSMLLAPYDEHGHLLKESALGALGDFLREPARSAQLRSRTCAARKPWYAFHDSFPIDDLRRPKILCKDITEKPFFVLDRDGSIVPRHSVYYIVPEYSADLEPLADYLNSETAHDWLTAHCQRAAKGFLRLQSHVLKSLPVPAEFGVRGRTPEPLELALLPA